MNGLSRGALPVKTQIVSQVHFVSRPIFESRFERSGTELACQKRCRYFLLIANQPSVVTPTHISRTRAEQCWHRLEQIGISKECDPFQQRRLPRIVPPHNEVYPLQTRELQTLEASEVRKVERSEHREGSSCQ